MILKNTYIRLFLIYLIGLWGILLCNSCDDSQHIKDDEFFKVSFSVYISNVNALNTYSLDGTDEYQISTIDILLFDAYDGYYYKPIAVSSISTKEGQPNVKTFDAVIPSGNYQSIVLLANVRDLLQTSIATVQQGDSKSSVMKKIVYANATRWLSDTEALLYRPLPWWGEIYEMSIHSPILNMPVSMVRSLSKINVQLASPQAQANFKLESIHLYNHNDKAYIAPLSANWDDVNLKVLAPSIPADAVKPTPVTNAIIYDNDDITTEDEACEHVIYTYEALAGSDDTMDDNTCLVVGGTFLGDAQTSYYRIDFAKEIDEELSYLPLLRNHLYNVNIKSVTASGFSTPEEAFYSRTSHLEAEVLAWDESQDIDANLNSTQYGLVVSQNIFDLHCEVHDANTIDNKLSITSNVSWAKHKIVDAFDQSVDWVSLSTNSGGNGTTNLYLNLSKNSAQSARTAYIHIKSGRLYYVITVQQDGFDPQPKSNCYIVFPNARVLFPVSRVNDSMLGLQLGASEAFTVELLWTDHNQVYGPAAPFEVYHSLRNREWCLYHCGNRQCTWQCSDSFKERWCYFMVMAYLGYYLYTFTEC